MRSFIRVATILLTLAGFNPTPAMASVKVFILAGQSNMEGQAVVDLSGKDYNNGKGTLTSLIGDPVKGPVFKHLQNANGQWAVRDDVWVRYKREKAPTLKGPLSVGYAVYGGKHHFGPELQLGHLLGDFFTNHVLLIKTAWGGKSLYKDFRPPSSGGEVGPYYTKMLEDIREGLENVGKDFPTLANTTIELAGFVWYHGWNDGVSPEVGIPQYQTNLVNLIQDLRRDLNAPHLPVVIGELTGPWQTAPREWTRLREAQAAAASAPSLGKKVLFVSTRHFVRKPEDSPNPTHGHHEFGNAETYFLVGDALGKGLIRLLGGSYAIPRVEQRLVGWNVQVSDTMLRLEPALTAKALGLLSNQLSEIERVLPATAVSRLREITLWFSPPYPGVRPTAEYHPSIGWLRSDGRDTRMARCVEFTNIREFEAETIRMPNFVLHELAHGFHDRVLDGGHGNSRIKAAYDRALTSGTYNRVERWFGSGRPNTFEKAYAMSSPMEYFAESTEAYFSRNDFFPFNREELKQHDPAMHDLVQEMWKTE